MMRLKVETLGEGLHPSEVVVGIHTRSGQEEMVVNPTSVKDDKVKIGWPVGKDGEFLLVELPRTTARGASRVWVAKDQLDEMAAT